MKSSREKFTSYDKRKLTYDQRMPGSSQAGQMGKSDSPLDLPPQFESKINPNEHKRLREAFFI
jgi:Ca2+-binding EF-hand superfamily protein